MNQNREPYLFGTHDLLVTQQRLRHGRLGYATNMGCIILRDLAGGFHYVPRVAAVVMDTVTVQNTAVETDVYNVPVAANSLIAGTHIHGAVNGIITNATAADTYIP